MIHNLMFMHTSTKKKQKKSTLLFSTITIKDVLHKFIIVKYQKYQKHEIMGKYYKQKST